MDLQVVMDVWNPTLSAVRAKPCKSLGSSLESVEHA